jgi:hypothetical protein
MVTWSNLNQCSQGVDMKKAEALALTLLTLSYKNNVVQRLRAAALKNGVNMQLFTPYSLDWSEFGGNSLDYTEFADFERALAAHLKAE